MIYAPSISLIATLPAANTDGEGTSITLTLDYLYCRKYEASDEEKRGGEESARGRR